MTRCPVCDSLRIVIVISPRRRAFCTRCGARWRQQGSMQSLVRLGRPVAVTDTFAEPEPTA